MTKSPGSETFSAVAERDAYLAEFCRLARTEWPGNRTLTVACHGHSVPAGYFKTPEVRTFDSYPHLLHVRLKQQFPCAVFNVLVTAVGGENSATGAARFQRDVLSLRPDLVTIDYGLNDRRIGLDKACEAWEEMIESALGESIKTILLTPTLDLDSPFASPEDPLYQHAAQIRALAAKYRVGLVDSLAAFSNAILDGCAPGSLMSQPNHPNRAGHELVVVELLAWFPKTAE